MFFDYFASAVAEPRREKGAPIPLFERLIDEEVGETFEIPPRRFYNRFELIQSIEREVYRILNTRSTARRDDYGYLDLDQENFGLPQMFGMADFSQFDGANTGHWPQIAKICELAIERYEPRLKNVRLSIQSFDRQAQCLISNVEADLDIPHFQGEVTFPMGINT